MTLAPVLLGLAAAALSKNAPRRAPAAPSAPEAASPAAEAGPVDWVKLPGGTFMMGSSGASADEQPAHWVTVGPFEMARTEVTFAQYRRCVKAGACKPPHAADGACDVFDGRDWGPGRLPASSTADDQPVVCVDWDQARAYAAWAGGRLPSEAEWEYAARGGGKAQTYPWGNEPADCMRAVISDGGPGCGRLTPSAVCSRPLGITAQGLCDMAGNVWEWVEDAYHPSYEGAPADARAWTGAANALHVYRGGSWLGSASLARAGFRFAVDSGGCSSSLGLRPVRKTR